MEGTPQEHHHPGHSVLDMPQFEYNAPQQQCPVCTGLSREDLTATSLPPFSS